MTGLVQGTRTSSEVTGGAVEAPRAYVAEQAGPADAEASERLLGQLAALAQLSGERMRVRRGAGRDHR